MRAAVWSGPDQLQVVDIARPGVPDGSVLVRVSYTGLCGTDLAILHGSHPRATPPLVMGHELTGVVAESSSPHLAVGQPVAVEPLASCGECWSCRHDAAHVCRRLALFGIDAPGGLAEYVALPAGTLHPLPPGIDPRRAALIEPVAVAVHAVAQSGLVRGDAVVVFGGGPIGVLTALVARLEGADPVLVLEPNPGRREVVAGLGLTALGDAAALRDALDAATGGEGAAVTFDAAGVPAVAAALAGATRPMGTIVVVAVYKQPAALDLRRVNFAEQRVQGVRVYARADFRRAVRLVVDDALGLDRLPVEVFGLHDVASAFAAAQQPGASLKVLVGPGNRR